MNFKELMVLAKCGSNAAVNALIEMYRPLLMKESTIDGILDEDLYQEQCMVLIHCIEIFKF